MARSTVVTLVVLGLAIFGLLMVADASVVDALRDFADKWHYLKLQAVWLAFGMVGFVISARLPYQWWERFSRGLMLVSLVLLVVVLIPGVGNKLLGARRWLGVGGMSFQPAELAKLSLSLYLASLLARKHAFNDVFWPFIITLGVSIALVLTQPDMGTAMVILLIGIGTYLASGVRVTKLLLILPILPLAIILLIIISPYRWNRWKSFLDYSQDPLGSSYHIRQALLAIGSGGVFGQGLGQSRQKYEFLPETMTDSIFAVIGEEMGLMGSSLVILVFLALGFLGIQIAENAPDQYGSNLAMAITIWLVGQAFINISAMVALLPLTGIPMPFISYGGSSLVLTLFASGILVNIARQND